jgi:hypothetical protein
VRLPAAGAAFLIAFTSLAAEPREVPRLGVTLELPADAGVRVLPWQAGHYTTEVEVDLPGGTRLQLKELGKATCASQPKTAGLCRDDLKVWCGGDAAICASMKAITPGPLTRRSIPWLRVTIMAPANAAVIEQVTASSIPNMAKPPPRPEPRRSAEITLGARSLVKLSQGGLAGALKCVSGVCCTAGTEPALAQQICESIAAE